jgi:hypothetical protein
MFRQLIDEKSTEELTYELEEEVNEHRALTMALYRQFE